MDQNNRVLCRNGARELTEQETDRINGAVRTLTPCTIGPGPHHRGGDASIGECSLGSGAVLGGGLLFIRTISL
jgi:hypothetical protein